MVVIDKVVQLTVVIMLVVMVMHPELELPSPATGGAFLIPPKKMADEKMEVTTQNALPDDVSSMISDHFTTPLHENDEKKWQKNLDEE